MTSHFKIAVGILIAAALPVQARITGRVVDERGVPLAGVRVRAFARESFENWYLRALSRSPEAVPVANTSTDADGRYVFDVETPAGVDVVAQTPGKRAGYRIAIDGEEARSLILRGGCRRRVHVSAAGLPVSGALIVDRFFVAYTDASGFAEVEEPDGGIYESALVVHPDFVVARADPPPRDSREVLKITLNPGVAISGFVYERGGMGGGVADAVVLVDNLPLARSSEDGSWRVEHAPSDWRVVETRSAEYAGVARPSDATYLIGMRHAARIRGTVIDAANRVAIPGAAVWLMRQGEKSPQRLTLADQHGGFSIDAVPIGEYVLLSGHPDFWSRGERLSITAGGECTVDAPMQRLGTISGVVADSTGLPLESVIVMRAAGGQPSVTGADGRFFVRVPASMRSVALIATKNGFETTITVPIEVRQGEAKSGVPIVMEARAR